MKNLKEVRGIANKFRDLAMLGLGNIGATLIGGIFWFVMAALLGVEHYGEISYIIAISSIGGVIAGLGTPNTAIIYTAKGEKILPQLALVCLSASFVAALVLYFFLQNLGASIYVFGFSIFNLTTAEILGKKLYKDYSKYLITQRAIMAGLAIVLFYVMGFNGVVLGIGLSFFPYLVKLYQEIRGTNLFNFSILRSKKHFMINSYVLDLSRMFSGSTDKLIIAPIFGYTILGNYQLGIQFLALLNLIPSIVYQYILPQDASGISNKKLKKVLILVAILIAFGGIILSPIIIPSLFPKFSKAVHVIQIMSLAVIPTSINLIFISKFLGALKNRIVLFGSAIFLVVLVSAIISFGNLFGINGVAAAYVLATSSETVFLLVASKTLQQRISRESPTSSPEYQEVETTISLLQKISKYIYSHLAIFLIFIGIVAVIIRLDFFPAKIPLTGDALQYFWYANDISILHHFPSWSIDHNGWPAFLSIFFIIFHSHSFLEYMNLQRAITIAISVLTIIPVYLLCKKFVNPIYALLGTAIFAFEPRIIQNSLLGITDTLYIFLVTFSIVLFLNNDKRLVYGSFALAALATLVRTEGVGLFLILSIMFYVRHRTEKKIIAKYALAALIFALVLLPMVEQRIQTSGHDFITSRISGAIGSLTPTQGTPSENLPDFVTTLERPIEFLGWIMIPIFIFFVPVGAYLIFRNRNHDKLTIIIAIIVMGLLGLYGSTKFPETRYLYPLYPLFCVLSVLSIKFYSEKIHKKKIFAIFLFGIVVASSLVFLSVKSPIDVERESQALVLAHTVANKTVAIETYAMVGKYMPIVSMEEEKFPVLSSSISPKVQFLPVNYTSLNQYIHFAKQNGIKFIVIDNYNRNPLLNDVFYHVEKYPSLTEVYDSSQHGYEYYMKIFKINYNDIHPAVNQ